MENLHYIILNIIQLIGCFIFIYYRLTEEERQNKHLQKRIKGLQIPSDDYARYQKAYVEFYRWLNALNEKVKDNGGVHFWILQIMDKYEKIFNPEQKNHQYNPKLKPSFSKYIENGILDDILKDMSIIDKACLFAVIEEYVDEINQKVE